MTVSGKKKVYDGGNKMFIARGGASKVGFFSIKLGHWKQTESMQVYSKHIAGHDSLMQCGPAGDSRGEPPPHMLTTELNADV